MATFTTQQLETILAQGEDSQHQFKRNVTNVDSLAAELVAFANAGGGHLIIGVEDDSSVTGLSREDIARLNQLLSNASSQHVRPPVHPTTQNMTLAQGMIMVVTVPEGLNKPYMDNQGRIWVKAGSDKRHVTAREEIQRMFQAGGLVYAEETLIRDSSSKDLNSLLFSHYIQHRYGKTLNELELPLDQIIRSLKLGKDGELNLAGLLLFAHNPQRFRPVFMIKAVYIDGTSIAAQHYRDSEDIEGCLLDQYEHAFSFITRNLHRLQVIASHATRQMPYRGLGSGIPRALESYAFIQLIDDREGNQFKVILQRPKQDTP